jgi:hypothetical protein
MGHIQTAETGTGCLPGIIESVLSDYPSAVPKSSGQNICGHHLVYCMIQTKVTGKYDYVKGRFWEERIELI